MKNSTSLWKNFEIRVKNQMRNADSEFKALLPEIALHFLQIRIEAAYLYDAILLYAKSLGKIMREKNFNVDALKNGKKIIENILGHVYQR